MLKKKYLRMVIVMGILSMLLSVFGCEKESKKAQQVNDVYHDLRSLVLSVGTDESIVNAELGPVKAVIMDIGMSGATVTVSTICDGTVSMYYSSGGGIIGCGERENIREIAMEYMKAIQGIMDKFVKTESTTLPPDGSVLFYVVTEDGIVVSQAKIEELTAEGHFLSPVFYRANILMAAIRQSEEEGK